MLVRLEGESVTERQNRAKAGYGDVFDYIQRQGGFGFTKGHPFNEVDALILSRVAYMYFEDLVPQDFGRSVRLKEIADDYLVGAEKGTRPVLQAEDVELMRSIKDSHRFATVRLTGYRSYFSVKHQEQFSALTVVLPDKTAFISFRGTDGSLNGWREDFDLGFLGVIPSDKDAFRYAKDAIESLSGVSGFRIGGHSKGGNLASYVACKLPKRLKDKVIGVYIFDAPGFRQDVIAKLSLGSLAKVTHAFAPVQSIIGMILYSPCVYTPVVSRKALVFQHDIYNWCIEGKSFVRGAFLGLCYGVKKMTRDVFETMDIDHVENCIDMLFGAIRQQKNDGDNSSMDIGVTRMFSLLLLLRKIPKVYRKTLLYAFSKVTDHIKRIQEAAKMRKKVGR